MCKGRHVSATQPHVVRSVSELPLSHPDVPNVELTMLSESIAVRAEQFCGPWVDSQGHGVNVSFDGDQVGLRATLITTRGHKSDLPLYAISHGCGWQCGNACLVAVSAQQLCWQFPNGSVSIWVRGSTPHVRQEDFQSEGLQCSPSTSISQSPLLPRLCADREENHEFILSDCQSPTEAFFNPHPGKSCHSMVTFFLESCTTEAQSFFGDGAVAFEDSGAKMVVLGDEEQAVAPKADSLTGQVWEKSLNAFGCREVQAALGNGDNRTRAAIASEMQGHVWEAAESPNANHVLQKCIVELPPDASQSIIDELMQRSNAATCLARHRYGCRIVERLLEHCRPDQLREMIRDILAEVKWLCVHPFGNFVIQHLFEYGAEDVRRQFAVAVLACMPKLSADSRGMAVVAKSLEYAPDEERRALARALLQTPEQLVRIARQRSGQAVASALMRLKDPEGAEARKWLGKQESRQVLLASRHGRVLMKALNDQRSEVAMTQRQASFP